MHRPAQYLDALGDDVPLYTNTREGIFMNSGPSPVESSSDVHCPGHDLREQLAKRITSKRLTLGIGESTREDAPLSSSARPSNAYIAQLYSVPGIVPPGGNRSMSRSTLCAHERYQRHTRLGRSVWRRAEECANGCVWNWSDLRPGEVLQ